MNQLLLLTAGFFMSLFVTAQQPSNAQNDLDGKQKSIVTIAAFTAKGDLPALTKSLNNGLDSGLTLNEAKEILVHLYAYTGFPRSLNAIIALESVIKERSKNGKKIIEGKESVVNNFSNGKFLFGKEVQTKLTGSSATGAPQKFVPVIDTFLKEHLFADIFGRDILDYKTREIITISALASLGGAEAQLRSHLNVGINTGLSEGQLKKIVSVLTAEVGTKEGYTAGAVLQQVISKSNIPVVAFTDSDKSIFAKGVKITNNNFSGNAWLSMLVNSDSTFNTSIGNVTFEPGVRTNWHSHAGGQLLLVISGKGRYQEKGKEIKELRTGDVIKCMPDIIHWHGAAPDSEFSHIAIGTNTQKGIVTWLGPVSDEEYNKFRKPKQTLFTVINYFGFGA